MYQVRHEQGCTAKEAASLKILNKETYSSYTIFWKQPFCILPCSKTPIYKYCFVILLHSKNSTKGHKNFKNWLTNSSLKLKNNLDQVFCMCMGGNHKFSLANLETLFKSLELIYWYGTVSVLGI